MWLPFTQDDIKARLSTRELEYVESVAAQSDSESPRLPVICAQVLAQFRGAVRGNPQVTLLGPAGTLPDFCIGWAASIARTSLIGLTPIQEGTTDPRRDEYRDAIKGLESLRHMHPNAFALTEDTATIDAITYEGFGGSTLLDF